MKRSALSLLLALALGTVARADEIESMEEIYGPRDLAMVSGIGRLTVGVNGRGRISLCKWPSPGYNDQISYRVRATGPSGREVDPGHGLQWGIRMDGELVWMNDPRWQIGQRYEAPSNTIMVTQARWPESRVVVTQRVSVLPQRDVFVSELEVAGAASPPQVYWFANFTPCTRHLPELPVADWLLDNLNDFAVFSDADEGVVVHFRPEKPGREDWERAERLSESAASAGQWRSFRDGTWIAYRGSGVFQAAHCGSGTVTPAEALSFLRDPAGRASAATGDCYSVVEIIPEKKSDRYRASVAVAFGESYAQAKELLDDVAEMDAADLFRETADFQRRLLRVAKYPETENQRISDYLQRAQLTILASRDSSTGSVVRSPAIQPPLARDWPRYGAWMIHAMDQAGRLDVAESHIKFYLSNVRSTYARGKPMGSLPSSTYTDGVEASAHFLVDDEAVAWLLWAISEHGRFLPEGARNEFFESIWEPVVLCTDFLADWKDSRRGAPLWAEDPITLGDTKTRERLFASKLGLDGAINVAAAIGRAPPESWLDRQRQIDNLVRGLVLAGGIQWGVGEPLPMFLDELGEVDEQILEEAATSRLQALEELSGYDAAKAFAELAMLWRGQPDKLARLRPYTMLAMQNSLTEPGQVDSAPREPLFPDALVSALCIIAAHIVLAPPG
ncbi:MAG: hypothetical protein IID09_00035 [Candidatus Hydrogenedentes bacterium]|nr:hypothetical protein [Candidatus Hydrogenedentota bacterium]